MKFSEWWDTIEPECWSNKELAREAWCTQQTQINELKSMLHYLHVIRSVSMDPKKVNEVLNKISDWSYAHRQGNGALSEKEQRDLIQKAYIKMVTLNDM